MHSLQLQQHVAIRVEAMRESVQRLTEARAKHAESCVDLELCSVRMAHDAVPGRVHVCVPTPGHGRPFVRTDVAIDEDVVAPTNDDDGVLTRGVRIEPATLAVGEILEAAEKDLTCQSGGPIARRASRSSDLLACGRYPTPFGGGGPLGAHLSRTVNRKSCEVSAPIGVARACHESSCRSMSASYST
jgi:hypothetical protein